MAARCVVPGKGFIETGDMPTQIAADQVRKELKKLLKAAIESGDSELVRRIREALDKLDDAARKRHSGVPPDARASCILSTLG